MISCFFSIKLEFLQIDVTKFETYHDILAFPAQLNIVLDNTLDKHMAYDILYLIVDVIFTN